MPDAATVAPILPETTEWRGRSGSRADSLLWMLLWGRGSTATGAQPANPRTTPRSAPELLLEWQEEAGLPPTRHGGRGWGGQVSVFIAAMAFSLAASRGLLSS